MHSAWTRMLDLETVDVAQEPTGEHSYLSLRMKQPVRGTGMSQNPADAVEASVPFPNGALCARVL